MGKEEIFSKLNIKDYNNELENIIEKKAFSEDVKNLLLSMFYKIEDAYDDYKKIKSLERTKKEELELILNTINNDCNEIELVKPKINEETILGEKKVLIVKKDKKIICYPNEKSIFYGICMLQEPKYIAQTELQVLNKAITELFNCGAWTNEAEIIRDFDGWSWNIEKKDIESFIDNLIYQDILILIGEVDLDEWRKNKKYFNIIKEKIGKKSYKNLCIIALNEYIKSKSGIKEEIEKDLDSFNNELAIMSDKKSYLGNLAKEKKKNEAEIRKIDNLLSNLNELKQNFLETNSELEEDKKIFSLSDFVEIKQNKRKKLIDEIKNYSENMKPNIFVEKKENIQQNVEILQSSMNEEIVSKSIIELQKEILKNLIEKINKIETKKEIYDIIYKLRYYKEIFVNDNIKIKEMKELRTLIRKAEKSILTVACNFKVLNILSNSVEENYKLMEEIFDCNMIDLEDIILEFSKKNNKTILYIYEDEILSKTKEYEKIEDLNAKFNKKFKLFI